MLQDDQSRGDLARLYSAWLWADRTGDFESLRSYWPQIRKWIESRADDKLVDCGNGRLSGLIAWCRLARRFADPEAEANGLRVARQAMRDRLSYEFAYPKGGLIVPAPTGRSVYARWRNLSPEVGRLLATFAGDIQKDLMAVYVDYHRPTWYLAWNVETLWRNESPFDLPTSSMEIFSARDWILSEKPQISCVISTSHGATPTCSTSANSLWPMNPLARGRGGIPIRSGPIRLHLHPWPVRIQSCPCD